MEPQQVQRKSSELIIRVPEKRPPGLTSTAVLQTSTNVYTPNCLCAVARISAKVAMLSIIDYSGNNTHDAPAEYCVQYTNV